MGEPVCLRPAGPADLEPLLALARSRAVAPYVAWNSVTVLERSLTDGGPGDALVAETPAGRRAGAVRLVERHWHSRIWTVETLMVDPGLRRRGLGTAIVRCAVARLIGAGAHRLEAEVMTFNTAAVKTFQAGGFEREGVRRRAYDRHGAWQDSVLLALVNDEVPPGRRREPPEAAPDR